MTPAKRGVAMYPTDFCAVAHALTLTHLLRIFQPLVLVAQSGQRRAGQRIEGRTTGSAAITLQSRCRTPARDVIMAALGTQWLGRNTTFKQCTDGLNVFNLVQTIYQNASLMRRQFLKLCRQGMKFFGFHHSTYLIDWYGDSIDHYLTVT